MDVRLCEYESYFYEDISVTPIQEEIVVKKRKSYDWNEKKCLISNEGEDS